MTTLNNTFTDDIRTGVKGLRPRKAIWHFFLAGLGVRLSFYHGMPLLQDAGLLPFEAFIVAFTVPMAILFAFAFGFAQAEGVPINLAGLAQRFRLKKLTWRQAGWLLAGLLLMGVLSILVAPVGAWTVRALPFLKPPATFPPFLDPAIQSQASPALFASWMGPEAAGNWGWALLALTSFFFNIMGEELYWRGLLLPRQEKVHGRWTWLVHGLMWNLFHLPVYPWYLIAGLPATLIISFVAQKTQNSWTAILLHGISNLYMTAMMIGVVAVG